MTTFKNWVLSLLNLFHSVKDETLYWQKNNQAQQSQLKHSRILATKKLEAELKKKSIQLEHEISLLRTKNDTELIMLKTKCKQDIKDYKQYLNALDQLKHSLQLSYKQLPEAVAFTLHHHAKHLLNQMWEAQDFEQRMLHEMQLINFMTTLHEDTRHYLEGANTDILPQKTLNLIQKSG
jgi:hypothetical protein